MIGDELSGSGKSFLAVGVMSFSFRQWGGRLVRPRLILRLYVVTGDELSRSGKMFRAFGLHSFFFIGRVCPRFNWTYTVLASVCSLIFYRKLTPTIWVCAVALDKNRKYFNPYPAPLHKPGVGGSLPIHFWSKP